MNMNTAEENKRSFNNFQVKEAERARELTCRIAFPTEQECKEIVSNEVLEDFPVTSEAIKNADKHLESACVKLKIRLRGVNHIR